MRKRLILSALLAMSLVGAASAQEGPVITAPASYSDVPAGIYAANAVKYVSQSGIMQGFPDGTFRGNEPLTRYQAALIFYRLLSEGLLSKLSPQGQTIVTEGMKDVAPELAALGARLTALETANTTLAARVAALETQVQSLSTATQPPRLRPPPTLEWTTSPPKLRTSPPRSRTSPPRLKP